MFHIFFLFFLKKNRQEAAGALWNLSFDDRNREAIAASGGVEALVNNPTFLFYLLFVSPIRFYLLASQV